MRTFGFALAAAAATVTLMAAPAAFAADGAVTWKGLDLTTDAGRTELSTRIDTAAREMCRSQPTTGTILDRSRSCMVEARSQIRAQLATKLPATAFATSSNSGALASAGDK